MAYAAVTSLLQLLEQLRSSSPSLHRVKKKQIDSLYDKFTFLQSFIEDSENKCDDHDMVESLETCIREVSYRVEDFIEELLFDHPKESRLIKNTKRILTLCPRNKNLSRIAPLEAEVLKIFDDARHVKELSQVGSSSRELSSRRSFNRDDIIVGLHGDQLKIMEKLTGLPYSLEIVTIVGMGGIGKTTLARRVFDDPFIGYHFYTRAWVTVSQKYKVRDLLLAILTSVTKMTDKIYVMSNEKVEELLYRSLQGRRYLIVMDDMWSSDAYDYMKRSFPDDGIGSRILVTSRLVGIANDPHKMHFLNSTESLELLLRKVSLQNYCPPELVEIGINIAEKCQGLPLAIVVVAGVLAKISNTPHEWSSVSETVGSILSRDSKKCSDIFRLSYSHLPHRLKACFLHIGAFTEDIEIPVWRLIRLWIAEGFVSTEGNLEELAEKYLEELIDRSLILVGNRGLDGRVKTCRMHHLLRDFCLQEAGKQSFLHVVGRQDLASPGNLSSNRRLCTQTDIFPHVVYEYHNPFVRSFLSVKGHSILSDSFFRSMGFKLLRVLDIILHFCLDFPMQILKLIHLRYLALSTSGDLPALISKLASLQTLIVYWGRLESHILPWQIWNLSWLRHVHLRAKVVYLSDPFARGKLVKGNLFLKNLQTLSMISSVSFTKEVLAGMPNIKKLSIQETEDKESRKDWITDSLNNLVHLRFLEKLKLSFCEGEKRRSIRNWTDLPLNLKKLTMSGSRLPWEEMVILGTIPNLQVLKLKSGAFQGAEWEVSEGGFCKLKVLHIEKADLVHWKAFSFHFPILEHLILKFCNRLREIPHDIGEISTLRVIELNLCYLAEISAKKIQQEQLEMGNEGLVVRTNWTRKNVLGSNITS